LTPRQSLLTIFRARQGSGEQSRERDASIDRCDVAIDDGLGKKSRLVARVSFRNGMLPQQDSCPARSPIPGITASHSLPYEVKPPTHAKFNRDEAGNRWAISSRTLRQLMDHFGPGIELLDINTDDEARVVNFTCFTEKVQKRGAVSNEGKHGCLGALRPNTNSHLAVLKKPLHTNIAVEMDEFDDVDVQDKLHIIISVKDFRAILQHAQMTSGALTTSYSNPGRPMKLSYNTDGVLCEFILMTVGEKDAMAQKHKNPRASAAKAAAPQLDSASHRGSSVGHDNQQAPPEPASASRHPQQKTPVRPRQPAFEIRPSPMPPSTTARSDSLFVDQAEDDEQWEPVNPDEEEEEENGRLEWNATNEPVWFFPYHRLTSLLTSRDRIRHPCASEVIFPDRPRLKRLPLSGLYQVLSRPNGSLTYVPLSQLDC
jgi:cell cycle checkpoint control protein RAD9A